LHISNIGLTVLRGLIPPLEYACMNFAMLLFQNQPDSAEIQRIVLAFIAVMPIFILVGLAVVIVPVWFICKKAGFSPWLSLLCAVPLGNLILLYVLAFSEWRVAPVVAPRWDPPYPPPA
jgi:hypothetical protein